MKTFRNLSFALFVIFIFCCGDASTKKSPSLNIDSVKNLIRVPLCRQATNYTCGVSALQSILYYYGDEFREDILAANVAADSYSGTGYLNIADFADSLGYNVEYDTNLTIDYLKNSIDSGIPVIVAIQAWTDSPQINWVNDWDDGHYVVAIGYDEYNFYFMDPSTLGNYAYIPLNEFISRWHDTDSDWITPLENFGIRIWKPAVKYDRNSILKID